MNQEDKALASRIADAGSVWLVEPGEDGPVNDATAVRLSNEDQRRLAECLVECQRLRNTLQLHGGDVMSLNNEVELFREQRDEAETDNARLRAALKPFADAVPLPGRYLNTVRLRYYSDTEGEGWTGSLTPEDFFAARRALNPPADEQSAPGESR